MKENCVNQILVQIVVNSSSRINFFSGMAIAVDRASLIIDSVFKELRPIRNALLTIGLYYSVKGIASLGYEAWRGIKTFGIARVFAASDLQAKYGEWAVVTGGVQGVGEQYAYELARKKMNIILLSSNTDELNGVAHKIRDEFEVKVEVLTVDFCQGEIAYPAIRSFLEKKDVGVLINNVQIMEKIAMPFYEEVAYDLNWQFINVCMVSVAAMSQIVLPLMVKRGRGAIVNVGSSAGLFPQPFLTHHSASMAYVDHLSQSIEYEVRGSGVDVLTLTPIDCSTNFLLNSSYFLPNPRTFARSSLAALGWERRTTGYWSYGLQAFIKGKLPDWILIWFSYYINRRNYLLRSSML